MCVGQVHLDESLRELRHQQTGHERGCTCDQCLQYDEWWIRRDFGCEIEPGPHRWLADQYLSVIEPDRVDLTDAPEWMRQVAIVGDNVRAEARERARKDAQSTTHHGPPSART